MIRMSPSSVGPLRDPPKAEIEKGDQETREGQKKDPVMWLNNRSRVGGFERIVLL